MPLIVPVIHTTLYLLMLPLFIMVTNRAGRGLFYEGLMYMNQAQEQDFIVITGQMVADIKIERNS